MVGWSGKTLEYAMKVRDHGDPELLEAADKNVLSVSMAVKLVGLPKSQQREIVRAEDPYSAAKDAISRLVPITGIRQEGGGESRTPIAIQVVTEGGPNQTRPVLCSVTTEPLSEQHTAPVRQATAVARAASAPAALVCPSSTELNFAIASVGDIQADLKRIRRMRTSEKRVAYMENVIVHLRSIASHLEQEMRATASK